MVWFPLLPNLTHHDPTLTVEILNPSQKSERQPDWNGWSYESKFMDVEVTFNGMEFLLNFMKIYQLIRKLLVGNTDEQTDSMVISQASISCFRNAW
jgi:hypothetical protein